MAASSNLAIHNLKSVLDFIFKMHGGFKLSDLTSRFNERICLNRREEFDNRLKVVEGALVEFADKNFMRDLNDIMDSDRDSLYHELFFRLVCWYDDRGHPNIHEDVFPVTFIIILFECVLLNDKMIERQYFFMDNYRDTIVQKIRFEREAGLLQLIDCVYGESLEWQSYKTALYTAIAFVQVDTHLFYLQSDSLYDEDEFVYGIDYYADEYYKGGLDNYHKRVHYRWLTSSSPEDYAEDYEEFREMVHAYPNIELATMNLKPKDHEENKKKLAIFLKNDTVRHLLIHEHELLEGLMTPEWRQAMLQTCQRNRALYAMKATMLCSAQLSGSGLALGSFLWRHIFHEHVIPFFSLDLEN
jgi:hypothetical protein